MNFVKDSVNQQPIVDTVFTIVAKAKEAKEKYGADQVVDATIGSLYNEEGQLVALDSVFNSLKNLDNKVLAKYAASFTGNPTFRQKAYDWVLDGNSHLEHEVVATPGGTGAVSMTIQECLDEGQTVILPEIAWGSYALMAQMHNLEMAKYSLFEGDHFNIASFKETCLETMKKQNKLVIVINDPCQISDNVIVVVSFSLSKSMTSYGLRCGAAIILGQKKEAVNQVKIVFEKNARATWSNINNGAMETFVDVLDNHGEEYDQERLKYVHLLKERGDIFTTEADEVGLKYYSYKEGFFVTLAMDNETRDKYHEALMANNIFTVKVNLGIRVAICSLSVEKTKGLAKKMKDILDTIQ